MEMAWFSRVPSYFEVGAIVFSSDWSNCHFCGKEMNREINKNESILYNGINYIRKVFILFKGSFNLYHI